jgi:hypothetical protein
MKSLKGAPTVHELLERSSRNSVLIEDDSSEPQVSILQRAVAT